MNKIRRIKKQLESGERLESDFLEFESKGYTNVIKYRLRRLLGHGRRLVVKNGKWMIQNCAGIGGLIVMAILVVLMSVLSYYVGKPNTIDACLIEFGITDIEINE